MCSIPNHSCPLILDEHMALLNVDFSFQETKDDIFSIWNLKSSGPNGYHPLLFKSHWNHIGKIIYHFIYIAQRWIRISSVMLIISAYLNPKISNPSSISQFKAITLCNVVYKIITKMLINHIKHVMSYVVRSLQTRFIKGQNFVDNYIILHELVHSFQVKSFNLGYMIIELDLQKLVIILDGTFPLIPSGSWVFWIGWLLLSLTTLVLVILPSIGMKVQLIPSTPVNAFARATPCPFSFLSFT